MTLTQTIKKLIQKPLGAMIDEESLVMVLRRRLTKKEYKVLSYPLEGLSDEDIKTKLKLDSNRLKELRKSIQHKLNQDKIKLEIYKKEAQ